MKASSFDRKQVKQSNIPKIRQPATKYDKNELN